MTYESEFLGDLMWLAVPAGDDDITDKRRRSDSGLTQKLVWGLCKATLWATRQCTLSHRTSSHPMLRMFILSFSVLSLKNVRLKTF